MNYQEGLVNVTNIVNVRNAIIEIIKTQPEDYPFFVCNLDDIIYKYKLWKKLMPRIEPHYAVKCNNSNIVVRILAALGMGFDCASKNEIQQILSIGVDPSKIIFAHTVKLCNHIEYAVKNNINLMTFDNEKELEKIQSISLDIQAVIRIKYDSKALSVLGLKFGCDPYSEAQNLLEFASNLKINVIGVSFHIGSGSEDPSAFYQAIKAAHYVFQIAENFGFQFKLLDIGGGFPGNEMESMHRYAKYINSAIDEFFCNKDIKIISEPGTYFVESSFTLLTCIFGVKENKSESEIKYSYYINDGVFGNFNGILSYNLIFTPELLYKHHEKKYMSVIRGPTTDIKDVIQKQVLLPKMNRGDYLMFNAQGSYRHITSTYFNGFHKSYFYYVISQSNWDAIYINKNFDILHGIKLNIN